MAIKKTIEIDVDQVQAMGGLDALQKELEQTETVSLSLKKELKLLKEQLATLPEGTEEYNKIAKRAGEVSDNIGDISTRVKNLGSDTKHIDAVVQGTQTLSGAFSVATSASALLGDENKDLQETMLKVESAIGLTVGIQSIANALQKESALAIGINSVATKAQIGFQLAYTAVVGGTTGALKALRVALVSTGVGALVVGLGFLVAKLTESKEATEDNEKALESLTEAQKRFNQSLQSELSGIENSTKARVLRAKIAGQSEAELRDIEKNGEADRATAYDAELKRLDKELQNNKLTAKEYKLLLDQRNKLADESLKLAQDRDNQQLEFELSLAEKRRGAEEKANKTAEEKLAERKKALEEYNKSVSQGLIDLQINTNNAEFEQREINIENKQAQVEQLAELGRKNTKDEEAEAEARKKIAQAEADAKQQAIEGYGSALEKVSGIIGTQTVFGKALAISASLINTYASITGQLKAFSGIPIPGYAIAQAIATGAVGFANVAKIASVKVPGGGGGSGSVSASAGGGGSNSTPQFNIVGQSSTNQLTSTIAGQQNQPIQTYVVGSQVTNQQALDRNAQQTSSF